MVSVDLREWEVLQQFPLCCGGFDAVDGTAEKGESFRRRAGTGSRGDDGRGEMKTGILETIILASAIALISMGVFKIGKSLIQKRGKTIEQSSASTPFLVPEETIFNATGYKRQEDTLDEMIHRIIVKRLEYEIDKAIIKKFNEMAASAPIDQ